MLALEEGVTAIKYARAIVESFVKNKQPPTHSLTKTFEKKLGVFVTIHTHPAHNLRGCIGIPLPVMSLKNAIKEAGVSVTHDPRFPPLQEHELDTMIIEVTILTEPEQINAQTPMDYVKEIKIGRDGLIISFHGRSGLLLPQVPIEQEWNEEEYLTNLCLKAGLPPDAWFEKEIQISRFSGQIFTELEPRGNIQEKNINEL